ncbi:hypothetical protein [Bacteroides sp.]|uniref:hypothetical protein n=1 Tax=Bacteroides sp. TaxID=29523 RepID=UPI0026263935|nr:hypothetical protein [Bacteroides sp.]MDD3040531.1 hypothetical protein [Bacteroides sp.]
MTEKPKCTECEHCKDHAPSINTRGAFSYEHPNQRYIIDYFAEHKIQKMPGFINFGKPYETKPSIKTSPAWCPKKAKEVGNGNTKH